MSKSIGSTLQAAYSSRASRIVACLLIQRRDSVVLGYTSHNKALPIGGVSYAPGFNMSSIASSANLAVDNLELTVIPDPGETLGADLIAGRWDNAFFTLFTVDWKAPAGQIDVLKVGSTGEVQIRNHAYVVEFRSLTQQLQQTQGEVTSKTCRARFGDARCRMNLPALQVSGTITAVSSQQSFVSAARTEVADYFGNGLITITSGNNAGIERRIAGFSGGAFFLDLPMPFPIPVGTTYTATPGCRNRHFDCVTKWANIHNMQAEPHSPGLDALTRK